MVMRAPRCVVSGPPARHPKGYPGAAKPTVRGALRDPARGDRISQADEAAAFPCRRRSMRKETTILSRQTKDNIQLLGTSEYQNVLPPTPRGLGLPSPLTHNSCR